MNNIGISPKKPYWSSFSHNTQEKISRLSLVTAHLLHHSHLFLRTWCWKDM